MEKETTPEFNTIDEETANSTSKWKKYVLVVLVVGILIFSCIVIGLYFLSLNLGITNTDQSKFVGTWQNNTVTFIFFSDGTCSVMHTNSTWNLKDGKLVIKPLDLGVIWTYNYLFSNNDRTLSLISATTSGSTVVFTKQ